MKKTATTGTFVESMQTAPRRQWGRRRPMLESRATEKQIAKWFLIGFLQGVVIASLLFFLHGVTR